MSDSAGIVDWIKSTWFEVRAERAARNKLLSYRPVLLDNVQYSPVEFYNSLIANLQARQVPGLDAAGVSIRQGGFFSMKRLYLQLRRERLVFEICAAPFGTGFFCSERLYDRRREARWYHYFIAFVSIMIIAFGSLVQLGWVWSIVIASGIVCLLWSLMNLSVSETAGVLQDYFSEVPVIGPIYQTLFHPDTYFRQDTNACYQQAVHRAVRQTIDDLLKEKGSREFVNSPDVMDNLHLQ